MSRSRGVAVGLLSFCLDDEGALSRDVVVDYAVCGGLLVDLALAGRLSDTATSIEVDPAPTGFAATDRLLADVVDHPDRTLEWWLRRGGIGQREVADSLVDEDRWARRHGVHTHPHFDDLDALSSSKYRAALLEVAHTRVADNPSIAATTVLAVEARLIPPDGIPGHPIPPYPPQPSSALVGQCGAAATMVSTFVSYLRAARIDLNASAAATGGQVALTNFVR